MSIFLHHPQKKALKKPLQAEWYFEFDSEEYFRRQSSKRCLKRILVKIVNVLKLMSNQSFEEMSSGNLFWGNLSSGPEL